MIWLYIPWSLEFGRPRTSPSNKKASVLPCIQGSLSLDVRTKILVCFKWISTRLGVGSWNISMSMAQPDADSCKPDALLPSLIVVAASGFFVHEASLCTRMEAPDERIDFIESHQVKM